MALLLRLELTSGVVCVWGQHPGVLQGWRLRAFELDVQALFSAEGAAAQSFEGSVDVKG